MNSLMSRARAAGLPYHAVYLRIHRLKWPDSKALSEPLMEVFPRGLTELQKAERGLKRIMARGEVPK